MGRLLWLVLLGSGLYVVVRHHTAYVFRRRKMTFSAFLGTAGWVILSLVALTALGEGSSDPRTRTVELIAGLLGVAFVGIGWRFA